MVSLHRKRLQTADNEPVTTVSTERKMATRTDDKIIWLDMEMTGLDPEKCHILEIACLISDRNLNIISNIFHVVVNQPSYVLGSMNDWCREHHFKSGLIRDSRNSSTTIKDAEDLLLTFLRKHTPKGGCPLAGNSIYMDKIFLAKYLPRVVEHLHYRLIDVTTITELCRRWYPNFRSVKKSQNHRAKADVQESIAELKYLRGKVFPACLQSTFNCNQDVYFEDLDLSCLHI